MTNLRIQSAKTWLGLGLVLVSLTGGTWAIQKFAIEQMLFQDAEATAHMWSNYLAKSVPDLEHIAAGGQPSSASYSFFEKAQKVGNVFRYKIFDASGRLRLISDELTALGNDKVNLGEHNATAAAVLAAGRPHVVAKEGTPPKRPAFFAEAYVPVMVDGRVAAIVEAYVDQTDKRAQFRATFTSAAVLLCLLTMIAFCGPALAWLRRTREKDRADEHIHFLAHHDAMTGLPNRATFMERVQQLCVGGPVALHHLDIDRFKDINDALGHEAGDALIAAVAKRLRGVARDGDIVARLGGDEFALLQTRANTSDEAAQYASRIIAAMARPFRLGGHEAVITACVGVALAPQDGADATQLTRSADLALHHSKADGRNGFRLFAPEMDAELQARLTLERLIREALQYDRFELHYQPLLDMAGERLAGFEALLRLPDGAGQLIPPATFIPVAEEMGLIGRVGAWVLREACRTAADWPEHLRISVNLSPAQFEIGSVYHVVKAALAESGLEPGRLELEITESLLLGDTDGVIAELHQIKALGVAIAMDDFGTGYSSLSYLWRFPFDKIKIDRAFMSAFDAGDANVEKIIRTIVALGRSLNMEITVEGIENMRQVEFLRDVQCDQLQGFHFGRPMPAGEVAARILSEFGKSTQGERTALAIAV